MPAARVIAFRLYEGEHSIADGKFVVTRGAGVSCFGDYISVEVSPDLVAPIFHGVVIHHDLESDGSAGLEILLYGIEDSDTALGKRQVQLLKAGLCMGRDSGEFATESVALGDAHEFVFQTKIVA